MKMKKIAAAVSLACAGFVMSPATLAAGFPGAGVDNVPSLAKFKVTFTKEFATGMAKKFFCQGFNNTNCPTKAREFTSVMLYEPNTKVGRSDPHQDGDGTDEIWGADVCQAGSTTSCSSFNDKDDNPGVVSDADFQWKDGGYQADGHPFDEGPTDRWEVHTQVLSFKLTPLRSGGGANAIRAGDKAPCQARSMGEVESLNGDGFLAESVFHMYVEVDVDWDNNGTIDMVLFNEASTIQGDPSHIGGDPLVIEATGLRSFPPKVVYQHTGNTAREYAPKLFVRGKDCKVDSAFTDANGKPRHIGWLRIATHGIDFKPAGNIARKGTRDGDRPDQCMPGEDDLQCFERVFKSAPEMPIAPEEERPPRSGGNEVALDFFSAVPVGQSVGLSWQSTSEVNNAGFLIWRGKEVNTSESVEYTLPGSGTALTDVNLLTSQLIPTEGVGKPYTYVDNSGVVSGNTYHYAIGDVDFKGMLVKVHFDNIASATVQ
ncbi:MAG: hypothetical protein VSS75_027275 [Candidatus Parabeggiatoa sp.]|nr:hypothetical protein [Candidatus Parabeggiatoa sp.]